MKKEKRKCKNTLIVFILIVIFLFITFGNSSTFAISVSTAKGIPVKIIDFMLYIILFILLFINKRYKKQSVNIILIIFSIFGSISAMINAYSMNITLINLAYGLLYPIRIIMYVLTAEEIVTYFIKENISFEYFIDVVIKAYVVVSIIGFVQLKFFPVAYDFYDLLRKFGIYILNPDPHEGRLFSTYLDPNFLSSIMIIGTSLSLANVLKNLDKRKNLIYFLIQVIALLLTVSRSGIIALSISIFIILIFVGITVKDNKIFIRHKMFYLNILLLFIVFIFIYKNADSLRIVNRVLGYKEDGSANARFISWTYSIEMFKTNNPFIGIGYNLLGFVSGNSDMISGFGLNSTFLLILVTTGFIGVIIYVTYILKLLYELMIRRKVELYYSTSIIAILISSIVVSWFNNLLFYPLWFLVFLIITTFYLKSYKKV